jgi:hypothetical protein
MKTSRCDLAARQMTFLANGFWCNVAALIGAPAKEFDVVEAVRD